MPKHGDETRKYKKRERDEIPNECFAFSDT